jgi:hypothetical protein
MLAMRANVTSRTLGPIVGTRRNKILPYSYDIDWVSRRVVCVLMHIGCQAGRGEQEELGNPGVPTESRWPVKWKALRLIGSNENEGGIDGGVGLCDCDEVRVRPTLKEART